VLSYLFKKRISKYLTVEICLLRLSEHKILPRRENSQLVELCDFDDFILYFYSKEEDLSQAAKDSDFQNSNIETIINV